MSQQHTDTDLSTVNFCPSCNARQRKGEYFCGQCGYSLLVTGNVTHPKPEKASPTLVLAAKRLTLPSMRSMLYPLVIIILVTVSLLQAFDVIPRFTRSQSSTGSSLSGNTSLGSTPSTPLYAEPGSDNWRSWNPVSPWYVQDGALHSNGTDNRPPVAPTIISSLPVSGTDDYAIEAKIQVISWSPYDNTTSKFSGFGLTFRGTQGATWTGYMFECSNSDANNVPPTAYIANNQPHFPLASLASSRYNPGSLSHTYYITVKGNHIEASIDGSSLHMSTDDNSFPHGGEVGLWATNTALAVTSLTVSKL